VGALLALDAKGFCCGVNKIFDLLGCNLAQIGSHLLMFQDNISIPLSTISLEMNEELDP
jgi:hypothetical protein